MLFACFAAQEGLLWWQLAAVEATLAWTKSALEVFDLIDEWQEVNQCPAESS